MSDEQQAPGDDLAHAMTLASLWSVGKLAGGDAEETSIVLWREMVKAEEELTRLRLRLEEATIYARMLAVNIHDRHYHDAAPWTPKRDLLRLLTQIDNMTAGLRVDECECRP